jgi:hypothetical protein
MVERLPVPGGHDDPSAAPARLARDGPPEAGRGPHDDHDLLAQRPLLHDSTLSRP